jgi:flagellar biosynthesis protein FlhF
MNVMRFVGRTSREAMRKLRDALGPDALVLANRPCADGVELLAAAPSALQGLAAAPQTAQAAPQTAQAAQAARPAPARGAALGEAGPPSPPAGMSTVSFQDYVRQRLRERQSRSAGSDPAPNRAPAEAARGRAPSPAPFVPARSAGRDAAPARITSPAAAIGPSSTGSVWWPGAQPTAHEPSPRRTGVRADIGRGEAAAFDSGVAPGVFAAPAPLAASSPLAAPAAPLADPVATPGNEALVAQLQSLKGMIERQFATVSWFEGVRRSPVQGRLLRTMVGAGFSLKLARSVVSKLPSDYGERDAQVWLEAVLARNIRCAARGESFDAGGVFALVGPTGVGKTTTTAKIAARHVLAHGAASVALITVDTYRLGAHDQLRAFGRILGVPVHIAHDVSALHDLLRLRSSRQLVLIDTVGMGHRDERIGSLLRSLPRADIRHVVVASCAAQAETIDESLRAYEARQAVGVVLTKVDEAARLGGALDCLLRQRLKLLGVCDGQRVPEDWHVPEAARLVRRALLAPSAGAFTLDDEDLPLVFGVAATLQRDTVHA